MRHHSDQAEDNSSAYVPVRRPNGNEQGEKTTTWGIHSHSSYGVKCPSIALIRTSTTVVDVLEALNGMVRKRPAESGVEVERCRIDVVLVAGRAALAVIQVATIVMCICINRKV
jgi:hypothetical protein